jgi:uncharacterized membrane protein YhaH (DUF805 family)
MSEEKQWYFVEEGKRAGPVAESALRSLIRSSRVQGATLVWTDGMSDWVPLAQSAIASALLGVPDVPVTSVPPPPTSYAPSGSPYDTSQGAVVGAWGGGGETGGPGKPMSIGGAISSCFSKYVQFSGRASRSEYWFFQLFIWLCSMVATMLGNGMSGINNGSGIEAIVSLVFLLPALSVFVRRLHDTDRSGWWFWLLLIPIIGWIVILVFLCQKPTPGRNRFG